MIAHIPTWIIHGRYDVVCPVKVLGITPKDENSELIIVPDAGHSVAEVSIARELVKVTNNCLEKFQNNKSNVYLGDAMSERDISDFDLINPTESHSMLREMVRDFVRKK